MELRAPSRWRRIDFISDLHLQASEPRTYQTWRNYLNQTAADAVFILGDLFEVWVGDDVLSLKGCFESDCADALRAASARVDLYIMQGNRDFLMGEALMRACHATLLDDPSVLVFGEQRWLLSHGDALCLGDHDYMAFRQQVRSPQWQADFLAQPLQDRVHFARSLRAQSEARKQAGAVYADVDDHAAGATMDSLQARHMIHGHTHRPGRHLLGEGCERLVLSDWDMAATTPRAEVLRLSLTDDRGAPVHVARLSPAIAASSAD